LQAIGLLIGVEEISSQKQQEYLTALLGPLFQQLETAIGSVPASDLEGPATAVNTMQQVILAIAYLSKGFGEHLAANNRPEIGANFKQVRRELWRVLKMGQCPLLVCVLVVGGCLQHWKGTEWSVGHSLHKFKSYPPP
jgi:hypothetical protein